MLGPRAEVLAMLPASGTLVPSLTVTLTGAAMLALILFDVACVITSVGTKWVPPPLLNDTASPGATRPSSTPVAPAAPAASTFRLIEQAPRSISATLPAGLASSASPGQAVPTNT